jgi:hypothetical protein
LFTNARYSRQFDTIDFVKCKGTRDFTQTNGASNGEIYERYR